MPGNKTIQATWPRGTKMPRHDVNCIDTSEGTNVASTIGQPLD